MVQLLLLAACALAAAPAARVAARFPQDYAASMRVALERDPLYASKLLVGFEKHAAGVCALQVPEARRYLETAVAGTAAVPEVKARLAAGTLAPDAAAALLLANALARPEQFHETADALEGVRPGLGVKAAGLLARAGGPGDRRLIAALRAVGSRLPQAASGVYGPDGRLHSFFDGSGAPAPSEAGPVSAEEYTGYGRDGRPRSSGLLPRPKTHPER